MKYRTPSARSGIALATLLICLGISGCGDGLSGNKYADDGGDAAVEFKSGHKAYLTIVGQTQEMTYSPPDRATSSLPAVPTDRLPAFRGSARSRKRRKRTR